MPASPASCLLTVKAVPNARRSELAGWVDGRLKVRLHAPPADGRANAELCRFLADTLGLRPSAVTLAGGGAARWKHLRITGLPAAEVQRRLGHPAPPS